MWPIAIANSTFGGHTHTQTSCLFGCLIAFKGNKNSGFATSSANQLIFGGSKGHVFFVFSTLGSQAICTPSTSIPWMPTSWQLDMWKIDEHVVEGSEGEDN